MHSIIVQASYIVKIARNVYGEGDTQRGKDILLSFPTLTEKQVNKILTGDAALTGWASLCKDQKCSVCKDKKPLHYEVI